MITMNSVCLLILCNVTMINTHNADKKCIEQLKTAGCNFCTIQKQRLECKNVDNKCLQRLSDVFRNDTHCVRKQIHLEGSDNCELKITNTTFRSFSKIVQSLRLSFFLDSIRTIVAQDTRPFAHNSSLKYLLIKVNKNTTIPKTFFHGLTNLKYLVLNGFTYNNSIKEIFLPLNKLKTLYLHYYDEGNLTLELNSVEIKKLEIYGLTYHEEHIISQLEPGKKRILPSVKLKSFCHKTCKIKQLVLRALNLKSHVSEDLFVYTNVTEIAFVNMLFTRNVYKNIVMMLSKHAANLTFMQLSRPTISNLSHPYPIFEIQQICNHIKTRPFTLQLDHFPSPLNYLPGGILTNCTLDGLILHHWLGEYVAMNQNSFIGFNGTQLELTDMSIPYIKLPDLTNLQYLNLKGSTVNIEEILKYKSASILHININYVSYYNQMSLQLMGQFTNQQKLKRLDARGFYKINRAKPPSITESAWFPASVQQLDLSDTPDLFDTRYFYKYNPNSTLIFDGMKNLTHLWLDKTTFGYNLSSYYPDIFKSVADNLEHLSIADSGILTLNNNITPPLSALKFLNLSGNRISYLDFSYHMNGFPALEELDLSRNNLQYIDQYTINTLSNMKSLKFLHIYINPFICGCQLQPLANWLRKLRQKNLSIIRGQPRCFEEYTGVVRPVIQDKANLFLCYYNWLKISVALLLGLLLSCTMCYPYRWKLRLMWILLKIKFSKGKYLQGRKVFVAYHKDDIPWIDETLIPKFEDENCVYNESDPLLHLLITNEDITLIRTSFEKKLSRVARSLGLQLFIKDRQMIYGVPEAEQIAIEIKSSQVVLLLASKKFFQSPECLFQSQVAQHDMLEQVRSKLVIFFLETVDKRDLPVWLKFPMPLLRRVLPCFEYNKIKNKISGKRIEELWIRLILVCAGKCKIRNEFLQ